MAPYSVAIRENWYEGQRGSLKSGARRRNLPITADIAALLRNLILKYARQDESAPLFQSLAALGKPGRKPVDRPVDTHNVSARVFKPLSKELGFPVTWYGFRRAHSTMAAITGAEGNDRKLTMGHTTMAMSDRYDIKDVERLRAIPQRIMGLLSERMKAAGPVQ